MTHGEKKFLIWFGITLALWRAAESSTVQDAFLQFLAVGEVPFTDTTLTPNAVFMVLATVFSASLVLIFRKEITASFRRRTERQRELALADEQTIYAEVGASVLRAQPALVIKGARASGRITTVIPAQKLNLADKKLPVLYVPSIRPSLKRARILLRKAAAVEYDSLKTIFLFIWRVCVFVVTRAWRFAKPYIYRMDRWLEKKIHKNPVASELLEIIEECWGMITTPRRKTEKS